HHNKRECTQGLELPSDSQAEGRERLTLNEIVGPQTPALAVDQPSLAQQAQMVRDGRLLDRQGGLQIADADLAGAAAQDIQDLHPNRVRQYREIVAKLLGSFGA